jgi:hypothetical protein
MKSKVPMLNLLLLALVLFAVFMTMRGCNSGEPPPDRFRFLVSL